jgi:hypothetical protein
MFGLEEFAVNTGNNQYSKTILSKSGVFGIS